MPNPTKWGSEFLVNTITQYLQIDSKVTALENGFFVVTWSDTSNSPDDDGLGSGVRAQVFHADGRKSGAEFLVNGTGTEQQELPDITGLSGGRFVITWYDQYEHGDNSSDATIRAQIFNLDGSRDGAEFQVNTINNAIQRDPSATTLENGQFVITWTDQAGGGGDTSATAIRAQIFNVDATKVGAEFLVNTTTISQQQLSDVVALSDGRFVVSWADFSGSVDDASGWAVRAQVFNANGSLSGLEFLVNSQTLFSQTDPEIAALDNGKFVVVWEDTGYSSDVKAQVFGSNGVKIGTEFLVNTTTSFDQLDPSVSSLSDGRFIVVWADASASADDPFQTAIRAQVFNADGSKDGTEFLVNTSTQNDQFYPDVKELADGRIIMTWSDGSFQTGDNSYSGINAQIFDPRTAGVTISGSDQKDEFFGTDFQDDIFGNAESDVLFGKGGDDILWGGTSDDKLYGGSGNDKLYGGAGDDYVKGHSGEDYLKGHSGDDYLRGGDDDDVLKGGSGKDLLEGENDNDTLYGEGGQDTLFGGLGDDKLYGGGDNDKLYGGAGDDYIKGHSGDDYLKGHSGDDRLRGGTGDDVLKGGSGVDLLEGEDNNDTLYGEDGKDTLHGGAGEDVLFGGAGDDNLYGASGDDKLYGSKGDDYLKGHSGNDYLKGHSGDDRLRGGSGEDRLRGNSGNDLLEGEAGDDTFIFDAGWGDDVVTDFDVAGSEKLDFTNIAAITQISDLTIAYGATDTTLEFGSDTIKLESTTATLLADDFVFV